VEVLTFGIGPLTETVITSLLVSIHKVIRIVSEAAVCQGFYALTIPSWKSLVAFQLIRNTAHPDFDWSRTQMPDEPIFATDFEVFPDACPDQIILSIARRSGNSCNKLPASFFLRSMQILRRCQAILCVSFSGFPPQASPNSRIWHSSSNP
jgi:hypothetical protein